MSSDAMIYVANIDGSEPRKFSVVDDDESDAAFPCGWSPDSTRVFVDSRLGKTGEFRTFAVDAKSGAKQEIGRRPASNAGGPGILSPDGQWGARQGRSYPRKISIVDLKSGREETVLATDAGSVVGWVPGTTKLVFSKTHGTTSDLLAVEIRAGKPVGEPEVLRSNFPNIGPTAQPLCITREGGIYYFTRKDRSAPCELWLMEGFIVSNASPAPAESWNIKAEIPANELILGPGNAIHDRKYDFAMTLPETWKVREAVRRDSDMLGSMIVFSIEGSSRVLTRVTYRAVDHWQFPAGTSFAFMAELGPKPATPAEADAWLRKTAEVAETKRPYAKVREGSIRTQRVGGHPALTYWLDLSRSEARGVERGVIILSDKVVMHFTLRLSESDVASVLPAFERMIETVRLP